MNHAGQKEAKERVGVNVFLFEGEREWTKRWKEIISLSLLKGFIRTFQIRKDEERGKRRSGDPGRLFHVPEWVPF